MNRYTAEASERLDLFLQHHLPDQSRSRIQSWIKDGLVTVNGAPAKASQPLRGGESIDVTPAAPPPLRAEPEDLPIEILYEDADVIAVNKAAGVVVHAGAGNHTGTLVNALLHRYGKLSGEGGELRPGIVHRIDRYTSGVLLVARNDIAHRHLAAQFSTRTIDKTYLALAHGVFKIDSARIDKPITRDPNHRTRMTARLDQGRSAITDYRVTRRYAKFTYLDIRIGTGRTHQIRAHMAAIGHPLWGDVLYGAPAQRLGERFFLHAHRIVFESPSRGGLVTVTAPLPPDLRGILDILD